ncbi:Large ribosomal subunit protein bL12m [Nakaseomyces bracarensis]|uniref:Large ribosomal subunit protein bL12m n=1 Tax=Nakaseomyces bracarensis TaxID=273131 RepID=A0ABR4NNV0_9SACH
MSFRIVARSAAAPRLSRFVVRPILSRFNSTASATTATGASTSVDPKISQIVDDISKLTLLETASLVTELKQKLNIADISFPAAGAAPAAPAAATEAAEEAEEAKPEEKTVFSIKLESFDAKTKAKVIKEIKGLLGLSLVEAKKFVEAAPKVLKDNVAKEDADKIKTTLEGLGAKVTLE